VSPRARAARLARLRGLYVIADDAPRWRWSLERVAAAALAAGVRVLQLRFKHTRDGDVLRRARAVVAQARATDALIFVNDRFDLADLAGADGVHLGDRDLPPERIPAELRERLLVGGSTHTLEQVRESGSRPLDYIGFGPVFATRSKETPHAPRSVELLARAVAASALPVVAIGGIDAAGLPAVQGAGAAAAAVISAVHQADDLEKSLRELRALCESPSAQA
jgi:thiamine-phosphate pyrophosphorylase